MQAIFHQSDFLLLYRKLRTKMACVSPAISNASLLLLLWKITLHFTEITVHFITKLVNCDPYEDSSIRFSCLIVLSSVSESRQNPELMKEKIACFHVGLGYLWMLQVTSLSQWEGGGGLSQGQQSFQSSGRVLIKRSGFHCHCLCPMQLPGCF